MNDPVADNAVLREWDATRRRCADAPAIFAPNGAVLRTFEEIESEAMKFGALFAPFAPQSVVAVQIGNDPAWAALFVALFRRALIPLPLGQHMEAGETRAAFETCQVAALVTRGAAGLEVAPQRFGENTLWPNPPPQFLKLTSGTTALPRAIRFRSTQLIADCASICRTMGITDADINYGAIPFSHSYGFSNLLLPLLVNGVPLVATNDRIPRALLNGLALTRSTIFPGTPVLFQKMVELQNVPSLPALRLCISAGAPLGVEVAEQFRAKFGLHIHTFYGASECGGIAYDRSDALPKGEGFVGTPMCGVQIEPQGGGEPALITIRGDAVADGYFPPDDTETLDGGRFVPSDLIRWHNDEMYIAGRVTDFINVAGRKLNPRQIEEQILNCPGVKEAVVFAVPSVLRGEEPVVCVVADRTVDAAALLRFCAGELSAWQIPKDIWMVDEMPVNERGKISRRLLAAAYLSKSGRKDPRVIE